MARFSDWLKTVRSAHIGTRNVICVTTQTTIKETFEILDSSHILSCPVVDENKNPIGMVDVFDIVTFIVKQFGENSNQEEEFRKQWELTPASEQAFSSTPVSSILDVTGANKLVVLPHDATLYDISLKLSEEGIHRVWLKDSKDQIHRLVTQSCVLGFICSLDSHSPLSLFDQTTLQSALLSSSSHVPTAFMGDSAFSAFQKMYQSKQSAVAIVDDTGSLVSNLSARDLRAMKQFNYYTFSSLFKTVREFIAIVRQEELKARVPAITCVGSDSVSGTLRRLVGIRVHQLWVHDSHHKPIAVVSTTSLLRFLVTH